jgi:hypothetical protein
MIHLVLAAPNAATIPAPSEINVVLGLEVQRVWSGHRVTRNAPLPRSIVQPGQRVKHSPSVPTMWSPNAVNSSALQNVARR